MKKLTSCLLLLLSFFPGTIQAQQLSMTWGLENTWSYYETKRTVEQDAAWKPESGGKAYRTFAFKATSEVLKLMGECGQRHFEVWDAYQAALTKREISPPPNGGPDSERRAFLAYAAQQDPLCVKHAEKQAPALYFDFVADSTSNEYVLQRIVITTLRFSEVKAGGFAKEQAGYDIVLSHKEGTKVIEVEKKLVFSGHGRIILRFWSDNFYPKQGWITGKGEYMIDILFVFSVAGRTVSVTTGPFKVDV
jgi:hypothetical protein